MIYTIMKQVSVILTDSDFGKIKKLLKKGKYSNISEMVRAAVRKL